MTTNNKIDMPFFIYGTAWKEQETTPLTAKAISQGFLGIDTANQPRHYQEALVGDGIKQMLKEGIKRENLFIQTKFTPRNGQDHRIPYDPAKDLATQVNQSFESSLENLQTDYLDSYLLHGPYSRFGLGDSDWQVWHAMEELYNQEKTRMIGISNVDITQIKELNEKANIKPMLVQNRCFASHGWDASVREYCLENNILYQGFSLLTANRLVWRHPEVENIAQRLEKTPEQVIFRFAMQKGMILLTGTTNETHMQEDLAIANFHLTDDDLKVIYGIGG